jgi:hypothetical protein
VYERWDRVGTLEDPGGYLYRMAMTPSAPGAGGRRWLPGARSD